MKTILIIGGLILVIAAYVMISIRKMKNMPEVEKSDKIKDLNDKNFRFQIKNNITLVDFWAPWCMPCKVMAPVLNEIAEEAGSGIQVCKVNVDNYQSIAAEFAVRGIPTMILFRNGKEVTRFVGVKQKNFLLEQIKKIQ